MTSAQRSLIPVVGWRPFRTPSEKRHLRLFETSLEQSLSLARDSRTGNPLRQSGAGTAEGERTLSLNDFELIVTELINHRASSPDDSPTKDPKDWQANTLELAGTLVERRALNISPEDRAALVVEIFNDSFGMSALEPLFPDVGISEIMVNGPHELFVERLGRIERVEPAFRSYASIERLIGRLLPLIHPTPDANSQIVEGRLRSGETIRVIFPPYAADGIQMTIRKASWHLSFADLVARGSVSNEMASLLTACVQSRLNILVSGEMGSGKTSLLNAMTEGFWKHERIITIETEAELQIRNDNAVRLLAASTDADGFRENDPRTLVRQASRMRADRLIVDPVQGSEALELVQAINSHLNGTLLSIRASSAIEALFRLDDLAGMGDLQISNQGIRSQLNSAIDMVVHVERFSDGRRSVTSIGAVDSQRREDYRLREIVRFVREPANDDRVVRGNWEYSALPHDWPERFRDNGATLTGQVWEFTR